MRALAADVWRAIDYVPERKRTRSDHPPPVRVARCDEVARDTRLPVNPPDKTLEKAVADSIADKLIDGNVSVLDPRDLARRAALEGFRQAISLAAKVAAEMAADEKSEILEEVAEEIRFLPNSLP
jgi:hypothetical protein